MSESVAVVSNAGPLMVLAKLNLLYLLKALYGHVHIAESVYNEVVTEGLRQGHEDARTLFLFLNQMRWKPESVVSASLDWLPPHLDRGERDTLALADKFSKSLVLMDELLGRSGRARAGIRHSRVFGRLNRGVSKSVGGQRPVAPLLQRNRPPS